MPNTPKNGGPPCPQLERLEEMMEYITNYKNMDDDKTHQDFCQEIVEALDWLHTSLSNRKTYQKKQQIKKKVYLQLARQVLSAEELKQVDKDVEKQLAEVVANEA